MSIISYNLPILFNILYLPLNGFNNIIFNDFIIIDQTILS